MYEFVKRDADILTIANERNTTQTKELVKAMEVNSGLSSSLMRIFGESVRCLRWL